jgi:hypothetical protein
MGNTFSFGGRVDLKLKNVSIPKYDCLLKEHWKSGKKHFLVLTDYILGKFQLDLLIKDIEASGIESYCIVSSITTKQIEDDDTETLMTLESPWKEYLTFDNEKISAIIALGSTIRVINKSPDVNWTDFLADTFFDPRYWLGSEFVNGPDCWVYPSGGIDLLYPIKCKHDPTNWVTRFFRAQLKRVQKDDLSSKSLDMRDYNIICSDTKEEISDNLRSLMNSELLSIDIETDGFHHLRNKIGLVQLSNDGETGYVFPWELVDKRLLNQVIRTAKRICGSNLKFDWKFFWENGLSKDLIYTDDTVLLSHAMHSDRPKGLKPAAIFWCGKFSGYDLELDRIKKRLKVDNYLQIPQDILRKYSGLDPIVAWRVFKALEKHVRYIDKKFPNEKVPEWTIEAFYKEIMIPNVQMATEVEFDGIYMNMEQFEKSEKAILEKIKELKVQLAVDWNVSEDFPFESSKELGILFKKMGWPEIELSVAGDFKTSDAILTEYESQGRPGIKTLKDLRSYNVALNTFINGWKEYIVEHDDGTYRIHPNCNSFGVVSYRHSMKTPNFQQIPNGTIMAEWIKRLFTVPGNDTENWYLGEADFSALQMRNAFADEGLNSGGVDQICYDLFGPNGNGDPHSTTGFNVFFKPLNKDIIEIENENGKIKFLPEQKIKIRRKNLSGDLEEMEITGDNFMEDDEFICIK